MMRILLDECGFGWDKAFNICQKVFAYTNHTVIDVYKRQAMGSSMTDT